MNTGLLRTASGAFLLALAACSSEPTPRAELASAAELTPEAGNASELRYRNPNADLKKYNKFMIDPVSVYSGPDATFGDTSGADRQAIADFMETEFKRVLGQRYQIVTTPGPDVARVHLSLAGLEMTRPALATVTHIAPVGLVMNVGKSAAGSPGSFMGSVTFAAEIYDARTNELLGAAVTKRSPNAMDLGSMFTGLDAAKAGVTDGADALLAAVDKVHGVIQKAR
jgi:hypothetical protein